MQFTIRILLLSMVVVAIGITAYHSTEYYQRWQRVKASIANFDGQRSSHEISDYYRNLFALAGNDLLPWILREDNDSVAIQSAWETVELGVPLKPKHGTYTPPAKSISKFLGLIESRRNLKIPLWWREIVEGAKANQRHNIYGGSPSVEPYHDSGMNEIRCPTNARLERADGDGFYIAGTMRFRVPSELEFDHICVAFEGNRAYVAFHEGFGYPHRVACYDIGSNELIWESTACGCYWGGSSGMSNANLSILVTGESVYVFGAAVGFYIHAFDLNSGKTSFLFCNHF